MSSEVFSNGISKAAITFIINQAGFDQTTETACCVITEIYVRYLKLLALNSAHIAQHQGRTSVNLEDVLCMLDYFNIDYGEGFGKFCSDWTQQSLFAPIESEDIDKISTVDDKHGPKWTKIPEPGEFPISMQNILIGDKNDKDTESKQ